MKSVIDEECRKVYNELKFNKHQRFVIYRVEKESVIVDFIAERQSTWADLLAKLPAEEPRFAVFDLEYKSNDGMNTSKLFFLFWLPDATKIKLRMLYATAKQNFKTELTIGGKQINISSVDDLNEQQLIKQFNK